VLRLSVPLPLRGGENLSVARASYILSPMMLLASPGFFNHRRPTPNPPQNVGRVPRPRNAGEKPDTSLFTDTLTGLTESRDQKRMKHSNANMSSQAHKKDLDCRVIVVYYRTVHNGVLERDDGVPFSKEVLMAAQQCSSTVPFRMTLFGWLMSLIIIITVFLVSCGDDKATESELPTTVTDIDGNVYQTVTIGSQVWMTENLMVTRYRNGDTIPNVTDHGAWVALSTGAYCNYNNDTAIATVYGRLYNWYAVNDSRNIAPKGWHVATEEEWQQLEVSIGISPATADSIGRHGTDEGGKLKEADTTHWHSPNTGATNESGFTALPSGGRDTTTDFLALHECSFFWSTEEHDGVPQGRALFRAMWFDESYICCDPESKKEGFSVRCVKD